MATWATADDIAKVNRRIDLLAVKVGANTDGVRSLKGTYGSLQAFAETAKTEQKAVRTAVEHLATGWDDFSTHMGFTGSRDRQQPRETTGGSRGATVASSTSTTTASNATAGSTSAATPTRPLVPQQPEKKQQQAATTSKGSEPQTNRKTNGKRPAQQHKKNPPKRAKDNEGLRMGVAVGDVMWGEQPQTTRGGRLKYPISGGGCLIAFKKPPRFTQAQIKKEIRKHVKANGGVSLQVPPESMEEWAQFCKACSESVFALFVSSLKDVSDDGPLYLLERIVEEVDNDDFDGFIGRQPQPLRAAMEAVLNETCFPDIDDGGKVDKKQLLVDTARAACEWHAALLDGKVPRSFTEDMRAFTDVMP